MEIQDILTLIHAASACQLSELEVNDGKCKVKIRRDFLGNTAEDVSAVVPGAVSAVIPEAVSAAPEAVSAAAGDIPSDQVVVSPLVGTFYSASGPDAENFVKVGDPVKKGQVLGIIEAMKLMNEIESECDGVVEAILVKNEEVVEYGQPLFRIR